MASAMLIMGFLMASLAIADAGVCYGTNGNNLPPPPEVIALYRQNNIGRMRIYDPNSQILDALRDSNIQLMLGVPNSDLENLANNPSAATTWVQNNVRRYFPAVRIRYIAVGNEANRNPQLFQHVVGAMRNIHNAVQAAGLGEIKVSTAIDTGVLTENSYPPSVSAFRAEVMGVMTSITGFLTETSAPLLANIYPYFSYKTRNGDDIPLSFALFTNQSPEFTDSGNNLPYQNLFDAQLDGVYAALEKAGGSNLEIVVSESGWPSAGNPAATNENARLYNQNLIGHVRGGSPKKPNRAIETYVFAMFNENMKDGEDEERNFGLFYPDKRPVYPVDFSA